MSKNPTAVPVFDDVDLLIVGGSSAGVALATEAAKRGLRVFVAAPRPFLGDDIVGDMRYWPADLAEPKCDLAKAVYADSKAPITPMHAKVSLEQAVVQAGIPMLLNVHPTAVLRDDAGHVRGCVLATRSGRIAVAAKQVVDATCEGILAKIAGSDAPFTPTGKQTVLHTTISLEETQDVPGAELVKTHDTIVTDIVKHVGHLVGRTFRLTADFGQGSARDIAKAQASIIEKTWTKTEFQHQERIRFDKPAGDASSVTLDSLPAHDGLLLLSCSATPALGDPAVAMNIGSAIAADVATKTKAIKTVAPAALNTFAAGSQTLDKGEVRLKLEAPCRDGRDVTVEDDANTLPVLDTCDVLVLGGGTGGAPACIAAGREGADTIVVEATSMLGGVGTAGQICKYYYGNRVGFTSEVDENVRSLETEERLKESKGSWSVNAKTGWYHQQANSLGVTMFFRSICCGAWVEDGRVKGLVVATPYGVGLIKAGCVVDASGCADVAAAAGAPTTVSGKHHVAVQGTGLAGIAPGRNYHNSDHNFFDDTDIVAATAAWVTSKVKYKDFFDSGQLIDSRERRQIIGDVTLGPADLLADRRYADTVCVASSNFDTHGFTVHPLFMVMPPDKETLWADVPFRALLAQGLDRVLATGLGVSAHRDALPVIRMQPDVQNQGYAAGHIAAISAKTDTNLRDIDIRSVQKHLVEIGSLPERVLTDDENFPVSDDILTTAVNTEWDTYRGLALIFSEPQRSLPLLQQAFAAATSDEQHMTYALTLGLLGDATGADLLAETLSASEWDEGWNYRGMGQFGFSLSRVDVQLIALANCTGGESWPVVIDKISALPDDPQFSHCRAVAIACETLAQKQPNQQAAVALADVLSRPGMSGHDQKSLLDMQNALTDDGNETGVRNVALRELHLARGLYRCGDVDDMGRLILKNYARDVRAHFARHARNVLATKVVTPEFALDDATQAAEAVV